jgi:hypothetical protein
MKTFLLAIVLGLSAAASIADVEDPVIVSEDRLTSIIILPKSLTFAADSQKKQVEGQLLLKHEGQEAQYHVMVNGCYTGTGMLVLTNSKAEVVGHGQWRMGDTHLYDTLAMKLCSRFLEFVAPSKPSPTKAGKTA